MNLWPNRLATGCSAPGADAERSIGAGPASWSTDRDLSAPLRTGGHQRALYTAVPPGPHCHVATPPSRRSRCQATLSDPAYGNPVARTEGEDEVHQRLGKDSSVGIRLIAVHIAHIRAHPPRGGTPHTPSQPSHWGIPSALLTDRDRHVADHGGGVSGSHRPPATLTSHAPSVREKCAVTGRSSRRRGA